jgi:hypothetical protein
MKVRPTNGVSYGLKYTVTADDATAAEVLFDFRIGTDDFRFDLVAIVQVLAETTGVVTNPADLQITYPSKGQVLVQGTLVAASVIQLIAQADSLSF